MNFFSKHRNNRTKKRNCVPFRGLGIGKEHEVLIVSVAKQFPCLESLFDFFFGEAKKKKEVFMIIIKK